MEVTKMREWLTEFKTLVSNTAFELQVVEGILYPYTNVQDETKYLKYISGEEFGSISDSLGNFMYIRFTENPIVYENRMATVDLVLVAGLPFCSNIKGFADLIIKRLKDRLVIDGSIDLQLNVVEVFKTEISEDSTKMKSSFPLLSISFTLRVPESSICLTTLDELACDCSTPSMLMSC